MIVRPKEVELKLIELRPAAAADCMKSMMDVSPVKVHVTYTDLSNTLN